MSPAIRRRCRSGSVVERTREPPVRTGLANVAAMRPATTLTLALLLAVILIAGLLSLLRL